MELNEPKSRLRFEEEVKKFLADTDQHEMNAGFLITKIVDSEADLDSAREELERIACRAMSSLPTQILNLLKEEGFHGESGLYRDEAGNNLVEVIRTRAGIPISLGLVAIGVAKERDLPAQGLLFPSHFLIRLDDSVVDPYSLEVIDYDEYVRMANAQKLDAPSQPLAATRIDIATRMLKNLQSIAIDNGECLRAFKYNDYLNLIHPDSFHLALDRSNIWQALGDFTTAKLEAERALALAPSDKIKRFISKTIEKSRWSDDDDKGFN